MQFRNFIAITPIAVMTMLPAIAHAQDEVRKADEWVLTQIKTWKPSADQLEITAPNMKALIASFTPAGEVKPMSGEEYKKRIMAAAQKSEAEAKRVAQEFADAIRANANTDGANRALEAALRGASEKYAENVEAVEEWLECMGDAGAGMETRVGAQRDGAGLKAIQQAVAREQEACGSRPSFPTEAAAPKSWTGNARAWFIAIYRAQQYCSPGGEVYELPDGGAAIVYGNGNFLGNVYTATEVKAITERCEEFLQRLQTTQFGNSN